MFSLEISKRLKDSPGYFADLEISSKKVVGRREVSIPDAQKKVKNPGSRVRKRANPKLKDTFGSGKILKWTDFNGQESGKMKDNSNLCALDPTKQHGQVSNKTNPLKVYTRSSQRRIGGGKRITKDSESLQKHDTAVMDVCVGSEG